MDHEPGGETIKTTGIAGVKRTEVYSQLFLENEGNRNEEIAWYLQGA